MVAYALLSTGTAQLAHYSPPESACLFPSKGTGHSLVAETTDLLSSFRMESIIALSGDHDDDEDTRLAALDELIVDIKVDSWLYNALQLERYPTQRQKGGPRRSSAWP